MQKKIAIIVIIIISFVLLSCSENQSDKSLIGAWLTVSNNGHDSVLNILENNNFFWAIYANDAKLIYEDSGSIKISNNSIIFTSSYSKSSENYKYVLEYNVFKLIKNSEELLFSRISKETADVIPEQIEIPQSMK